MNSSVSLLRTLAGLAAVACLAPTARAQDAVQAELRALRELITQQSKQLDLLTAQVARLSTKLDNRAEPGTTAAAPATGAAPTVETTEFAVPATPQEPPRPTNVHIVVKGESLERIAKTHGTSTAELQRLNRITDPKKLQIGQQLILPIAPPPKEAP